MKWNNKGNSEGKKCYHRCRLFIQVPRWAPRTPEREGSCRSFRLASIYLRFNDGGTAATSWLMLVKASSTRTDPLTSPRSMPQLASAKGHRYTVLCPCPVPAYLIGGQEWACRACQGPLSVGPRHQTQGPLLFEALGRLIGLLCRAPLWGSAQACSSCWVCRRRKEQRLIPLQVSLSVATLHFQWLGKVTSALDKPVQEPHKQHRFRKRPHNISSSYDFLLKCILSQKLVFWPKCSAFAHVNPEEDGATAAEQSNTTSTQCCFPPV